MPIGLDETGYWNSRDKSGKWHTNEIVDDWTRICWCPETEPAHRLSIHRNKDEMWIYDDPAGNITFSKAKALSGPFETLGGAMAAYVIMATARKWE